LFTTNARGNLMRRSVLVVAAVAVATAQPVLADPSDPEPNNDTTTTFTLTGGALFVSAPATADLGSGVAANSNAQFSGQLGDVFVIDDRAALVVGWAATVAGTAGGGTGAETIPAADLRYQPGPIVRSNGNAVFQPGNNVALDPGGVVMSATSGAGSNAVDWNPTITLHPTNTRVAGVYSGTIRHSVS
jgi:hypothetical protein